MKIFIQHEILKSLRESRTIPANIIAEKLGLSLQDYEKLELKDSKVDVGLADKIAGVFKRNWTVFLLDKLPETELYKRDNRTTENQTSSLHEKTIQAIEDANYIFDFVSGLATHKGLSVPKYEDIKGLNAEDLAALIRKRSKISFEEQKFKDYSDAFKQWRKLVEGMGVYVSQYPLSVEDKIRAFSLSDHDRAIIVLNTNDTTTGRIFSLFHELCHVIRRSTGICDLHYSLSSDVEVFCNRFSAAFLVPIDVVKDYVNKIGTDAVLSDVDYHSQRLASSLKVSQLVVYRRFATLGIITDSDYSKKHNKLLGGFLKKPKVVIEKDSSGGPNYYNIKKLRNGESYSNTVLQAMNTGEITAFEASNALGVSVNKLSEYEIRTA